MFNVITAFIYVDFVVAHDVRTDVVLVYFKAFKPCILFMGHCQTVQNHIRGS